MCLLNHFMAHANNLEGGHILFCKIASSWLVPIMGSPAHPYGGKLWLPYWPASIVTTLEIILSVFIRQITFSNQAYKKSPRVEGVRL